MIAVNIHTKFDGYHYKTLDNIEDYSHSIRADGGFLTASFSTAIPEAEVAEWATGTLANHVEVVDETGRIVWEGLINSISISYGGSSVDIGPLTDIANKVKVAYQTVDYSIVWLPGESKETAFASDALSQETYFIFEEALSIQEATDTIATNIRDTYLNSHKNPPISHSVSLDGGGVSVTFDCVGYIRMLEAYFYTDNATTAVDADTKIKSVLAADPNSIFSAASTVNIGSNTTQVSPYEEGDERARSIIQGIVGYGDGQGDRWLFAVYEGQTPYYEEVGTAYSDVSYYYDASSGRVVDTSGAEVKPWNVRPGTWAITTSVFPERPGIKQTIQDDDRAFFVESVEFSLPYNLALSGGKFDTVSQRIARLGILGIQ